MNDQDIKNTNEELNGEIQLEGLSEKEVKELSTIMHRFMDAYHKRAPECSEYEWLRSCYQAELPEWSDDQIEELTQETISSIEEYNKNLASAEKAAKQGISSEKWFASKMEEASKGVAINEFGNYLAKIDETLLNANAQMMRTVTTSAGDVSQCFNLDGFIAEQQHVNTYNVNSALHGGKLYAEVRVPEPGEAYAKNSVDCVLKNRETGQIVQKYQVKYGANAQETIKLLKNGNYNNQRILVPADQVADVQKAFPGKTVTSVMGDIDGISSNPLTKQQVKEMQRETQEGNVIPEIDYNTFQTKELALHIGKQAGLAGLYSAVVSTGFTLAGKALSGEQIEADEVVETAIITGADTTVKMAAAGAVKVGAEKGILSILPPGTPMHKIANIVCVGIENVKILGKIAKGELTLKEGLDKIGRTSTAMYAGLCYGLKGYKVGALAFAWLPIVGPVIGGVVGGMIGYMAGSKVTETIYDGVKKVGRAAKNAVHKAWDGVRATGRKVWSAVKSTGRALAGLFRR